MTCDVVSKCAARARAWLSRGRVLVSILACAALLGPSAARGQIPDTFENLQVLPGDISRAELTGIMRGFALALGVRCAYCHPGGSGGSLEGVDFKTDDDPDKEKARHMMKMVADLNASTLPQLPDRDMPGLDIQCITCHRGLARPITLQAELARTLEMFGLEAGVDRYRELRAEYYGRGSYDFGENSLSELSGELAQSGKLAEAIAIQELNAEHYPESSLVATGLGGLYARAGDNEKAIAAYERALELQPANRQARLALERLRGR